MYTNRHRKLILKELERAWNHYPDLRLGQLIVNVAILEGQTEEIFYVKDKEWLRILKKVGMKGIA